MKKIRVGVLFGGRSGEHEVSVASATSVLDALHPHKYNVVPIGITRRGQWRRVDSPQHLLDMQTPAQLGPATYANEGPTALLRTDGRDEGGVDVVIPLLHGPFGEDGSVQGFLETLDIPYVGSGVLGSALSMDKAAMKVAFEHAGLASVPWRLVSAHQWMRDPAATLDRVEAGLNYPVFVKPCNMGSSVGVTKASSRDDLEAAMDVSFQLDRRTIVEQGIRAREVECGVLGNDDPLVSVPGEIISHHEFYDYEAKYTEGMSDLIIPADLSVQQIDTIRSMARRAFFAVDAAGLARVDFFVGYDDGEVLINELNTMPGFTKTSMYPKLWEASGVPYSELLDRLIKHALDRHAETKERMPLG